MYVESLNLRNFRNYRSLSLTFNEGVNIFYGNNGQGKTSILEAVYLAGTSKSHRGSRDREMILAGEDESHIRMDVVRKDGARRIDIHLKKNSPKGIAIDQIPVKKAGELFGIVGLVFFSPEDLNIIKNGPSARRRFVNLELCQLNRIYLKDLTAYSKCLAQRNRLLRDAAFDEKRLPELDIWDEVLVRYGIRVMRERNTFTEELENTVKAIHSDLTGGKENLEIRYAPDTDGEHFREALKEAREKDLKFHLTSVGPHRDDLLIRVNGMDARIYGSQGQQRSAAVSLKLAEIEMIRKKINDTPILLLDDVLSELDRERQKRLLQEMKGVQTLITCTGLDDFIRNSFEADRVFHVADGAVTQDGRNL